MPVQCAATDGAVAGESEGWGGLSLAAFSALSRALSAVRRLSETSIVGASWQAWCEVCYNSAYCGEMARQVGTKGGKSSAGLSHQVNARG